MKRFVALYLGSPKNMERPDEKTIAAGMKAWGQWMEEHKDSVVVTGGPLGKTKRINPDGVSDTKNNVVGYIVVEAETHQAAAELFLGHQHFSVFPGARVEIMECLPVPGA